MPLVKIDMWAGRTPEQKEKMIKKVTEAICESVGCPKESVWVVIEDVPKENWGISGEQCSKK
jgi:4-oxalocrotonate tautomerase